MTTARGGLQRVPPRPSEGCDCPSLCALGPIPARPRLRLFPPSSLPRTHTHTQQTLLEEEKGRPINILPVQAEKGRAAPPTNLCGGGKHRTSSREGDPVAWLPPTPVLYQRLGCATIYGALEAAHQPSSPPLLPFPAAGGALCPFSATPRYTTPATMASAGGASKPRISSRDPDDVFELVCQIGSGSYGTVQKAKVGMGALCLARQLCAPRILSVRHCQTTHHASNPGGCRASDPQDGQTGRCQADQHGGRCVAAWYL